MFFIWWFLTKVAFKMNKVGFPGGKKEINRLLNQMGGISNEEKKILFVFTITILCWIFRKNTINLLIPNFDDSMIAISSAIILFILPSKKNEEPLMKWKDAVSIPWGILLLFGGGLSLAAAVSNSGLAAWIGSNLSHMGDLPISLLVMIIAIMIIFLTELTSNIATTATFLPVIGAIAIEMGINPIILAAPVTLAASCAFMLPVATPPNAIVFGSGLLTIPKMIRAGFILNIIGIIIVSIISLTLAPYVLG